MKKNNIIALVCLTATSLLPFRTVAQDVVPEPTSPQPPLYHSNDPKPFTAPLHFIPVEETIPAAFQGTVENRIVDEAHTLFPFFERLLLCEAPVRIVHIGDSHVRGHVYPYTTRLLLEKDFSDRAVYPDTITYRTSGIARETGNPGLVFHIFGVNGATAASFHAEEHIREVASLNPDLIIVSFGTNEAHGKYAASDHRVELDNLITSIRQACPNAAILLTTPPGAYIGKRYARRINPNTRQAAKVITEYAERKKIASWDLYTIAGSGKHAVRNWKRSNLFRRDGIHFTPEGYRLQGTLLYQAFIKVYNEYVANSMEQTD